MYKEILSNMIIINFISINTIYSTANITMRRDNRPNWAILIKYEGETEYICNKKKYVSNANNMVIFPKGSSYSWKCTKPGHYIILEFESSLTHSEILAFPLADNQKILQTLKELENKFDLYKQCKLESIKKTYDILFSLMNIPSNSYVPPSKKEKIQATLDYISLNYNNNIKNDELAALTPFSTVYFRKLFKETTGMSPITYIHTIRITKAKEMLKSDYDSISSIAMSLGYASIYDFSKTFRKYVGISPSQYLKSNLP